MIWCVGLNPAWDVTMALAPERGPEGVRTAGWTESTPGGKANNVARVVNQLGVRVAAVGLYGGITGELVQKSLREAGIPLLVGPIEEPTRICLTELDGARRREVRGRGPTVPAVDAEALLECLVAAVGPNDLVALSGSVPPGLPAGTMAAWIVALRPHVRFIALDAAGPALAAGWPAGADLVVPNQAEYRALGPVATMPGPSWVVVTRGAAGLSWRHRGRWHRVPSPPADRVVNATGAGDALLGAVLAALAQGASIPAALQLGVAVATASVSTRGVAVLPGSTGSAFRRALRECTGEAMSARAGPAPESAPPGEARRPRTLPRP